MLTLAGGLAITGALAACASGGSSSAAGNGALPSTSAPLATSAPAGSSSGGTGGAAPAVPGVQSFPFPAGVTVSFQGTLPASGPKRAAVIGYENYVRSLWYAVATHGSSTAYQAYDFGNARTFAQSMIHEFTAYGYKLHGTIVYYDISVPNVYYNAGAVVDACVDASAIYRLNGKTGQSIGTVFGDNFNHFLEEVSDGKESAGKTGPGGSWVVSHTNSTPVSDGGSAAMCS